MESWHFFRYIQYISIRCGHVCPQRINLVQCPLEYFFKTGNTENGENLCHQTFTLFDHIEKDVGISPLRFLSKLKYCPRSSK